jgi:ATP-dependent Clp protease protease subunit
MKNCIILTAILVMAIMVGCSGLQPQPQNSTVTHVVELKVTSRDGTQQAVTIDPLQERINKAMEIPNNTLKLSQLSAISKKNKKAFMKIFSGLSVADVTRAWNDIIYLYNETDIRDLHIFINSPGGDAFSGLALSNMIGMARTMEFKVTAHASGIIASAAVPVLASCDYRIALPDTIFMVHEAALWKWPGRETASDIRAQGELMDLLRKRYLGIMAANTTLPYSDWEVMEAKTKWFDTEKAEAWGLIDEVKKTPLRKKLSWLNELYHKFDIS